MDEHETMDTAVDRAWEDEVPSQGEPGLEASGTERRASQEATAPEEETKSQGAPSSHSVRAPGHLPAQAEAPAGTPAQAQPLPPQSGGWTPPAGGVLQQVQAKQEERRQRADMERFLQAYPDVQAESIPIEVWRQVAQGESLVSAYALHENRQLRAQLAAQQQDRANRLRTPGSLGGNVSAELDEIDRLWGEDD